MYSKYSEAFLTNLLICQYLNTDESFVVNASLISYHVAFEHFLYIFSNTLVNEIVTIMKILNFYRYTCFEDS